MDWWIYALAFLGICLGYQKWLLQQRQNEMNSWVQELSAELGEAKSNLHQADLKIVELEMSATSDTVEAAMESMMQESATQKSMIVELREVNGSSTMNWNP